MTREAIQESKKNAWIKIKNILDKGCVEEQFENANGDYYSNEKFIVTWYDHYKTMLCEFGLDKTDHFYGMYSGYKSIYVARNLVFEKQLKGYGSIEHGLIDLGMKLCRDKEEKKLFFDTYAVPYNKRMAELRKLENK